MRIVPVVSVLGLVAATWVGCAKSSDEGDKGRSYADAAELYPNLEALYAGDHGIYRGCGPNNGVCHNSREFPNLASLGSLVENIGLPCNQKRDDPTQLHDLCERAGDVLRVDGGKGVEIAYVEPDTSAGAERHWRIHLREPVTFTAASLLTIVRPGPPKDIDLVPLSDVGATVSLDPADSTGQSVLVFIAPPATEEEAEEDVIAPMFTKAGVVGEPGVIQVGDPNRNGTFGASLGGAIIKPGDPDKSYLFKRLTDPTAGPMMPRANCCFWTKASLRALWCWVSGLSSDGKNALDPIAYDGCPDGPVETMEYPDPGPECETGGKCPIQPALEFVEPTFTNVYERVLSQNCAGAHCHVGGTAAGLDMGTKERAYSSLFDPASPRVVAGDAKQSELFKRISPELCKGDCTMMPRGQKPLTAPARGLIQRWIEAGANMD